MNSLLERVYRKIRRVFGRIDRYIQSKSEGVPKVQTYSYVGPSDVESGQKEIITLARNPRLSASVHVLNASTPDNLHSHETIDGFWFVLRGRARFHNADGPMGEFGPNEGIMTPRDTKYWYESIGEEVLELLQVLSVDGSLGWHRHNYESAQFDKSTVKFSDQRKNPI